jgi:Ase1/PRC1/MAP65 family protein
VRKPTNKSIEVYTDALLTAHEMEIRRLQIVYDERAPMIAMIDKHRSLISDREQLAILASDSSRLVTRGGSGNRDPTRLLREEKMRKRVQKELPKVEVELKKALEDWEEEHGEPFSVNGEDYLQTLMKMSPVLQSRVGAKGSTAAPPTLTRNGSKSQTWNPPAAGSIMRARANTTSAAPKSLSRPKTPSGQSLRSKTPTGGPTMISASVGRSSGRSLAAAVHASSLKTPGSSIRIQGSAGSNTPSRTRTPLPMFSGDGSSQERHQPVVVRARSHSSVKQTSRNGISGLESAPKMTQLGPPSSSRKAGSQTQIPSSYLRQQVGKDSRRAASDVSTLSSSEGAAVVSVRSVSPEGRWGSPDENCMRDITPRVARTCPSKGMYSSASSNGDTDSMRMFSGSSSTTTDTSLSSGENWQTFGDESEDEESAADSYRRGEYTGYQYSGSMNKGPRLVVEEDGYLSESGSRY